MLFVLVQLLVPLRYYTGDDEADERFSWRMFSSVRVMKCRVAVYETFARDRVRRLRLESVLPSYWIEHLRRRQPAVVEAFLRWRCDDPAVRHVRYEASCEAADGSPRAPVHESAECPGFEPPSAKSTP